ncbi:microtubule-associated protein 10 [Carettochelys insculpta]|uniref:microtubule-associated protein 10 n=1 Tax=Carettochelys insculpta TaxID=44489 RepID=UPI003EB8DFCF
MATEAGGAREGLFSLELLVEWVRLELPPRGPLRPAVALRLLDFPTLLVRAPEPGSPPGPLVPFGRGKSCLFRLAPGALRGLQLHALLLALPAGPGAPRLLGSCCVPLAPAAEDLLRPPQGGTWPDSRGRRGRYPLRDLMGERVGELALGYRLSSLGPALVGHLPADLGQGVAGKELPSSPRCAPDSQCKSEPRLQGGPVEQEPGLALSGGSEPEPLHREEVGELESEPSVQPPSPGSQASLPPGEEEVKELEIESNIICPPPLYYTCLSAKPLPAQAPGMIVVAQPPVPQEQIPNVPPLPVQEACPDRGQPAGALAQSLGSTQQLRNTLSELPLLNALLVELSLLNNQTLQVGPSAVHPQLAWLYRKVEENTEASSPPSESKRPGRKDKETISNPSAGFKRSQQQFSKFGSFALREPGTGKGTKKYAVSKNSGFDKKSETKENTPQRKKLFYGLTNTLRLRLQQTNPDMLILHERREQLRKRQLEMGRGEKKGKSSISKRSLFRNTAEQCLMSSRHPARGGILEQNTQHDENIETLIQSSVEKNYSTIIRENISEPRKHAAYNRPNNHEENTKEENPYEVSTNSSIEGTTVKTAYKEKDMEIHLPRAFTQDTDAKRNKTDEEAVRDIHDKAMDDYNASILGYHQPGSNSLESNPELKYSDDFVGSPENTAYSEDFTSADYTGRDSVTLDSSPEPALVSQKHTCSDMESESKKSRISEKSLRTESISAPVPVASTVSPVHSLRRLHDIKAKKQSSHAAVSMSVSDSSPAGSLEQELTSCNKEDSKIDQNITHAPDVKSKQANSDISSAVKGQTSLEKSQSLRTSQVSSYLPSNMSDLELSGVENSISDKEEDDDFGTLSIPNQYKHISELVVNKLPGYTM